MKEGNFGTIYIIKNKINNKIYIGQTIRNLKYRIKEHERNKSTNKHLNNAINKYGWNNFEFSCIDTANTLEELNLKEIEYIKQYNSNHRDFGYNIEIGGKNAKPVIETLIKMSESHLGIKQTEIWINKRIAKAGSDDAKKYGREKSEEEKELLSVKSPKYWQGKNRHEETKQKISKTKLKNGTSLLHKEMVNRIVYKINIHTNELIHVYQSTIEAGYLEKVHQSTISRRCTNNKIINGILWTFNI